jgi:hypothetical protein
MNTSNWRRLRIFVEGFEDRLFVERIFLPRLQQHYGDISLHDYAQITNERLNNHFRALQRMPNTEFYMLVDYDTGPCLQGRRNAIAQRFGSQLPYHRILIVCPEIEAWYIAGVPADNPFKISVPNNADLVNKQRFNQIFGEKAEQRASRRELLVDILSVYDWQLALHRSASLRYCAQKLGI